MDALLAQIGENVDQLVTIDVLSYGIIGPLARAARARQGGPVCLTAAGQLQARVAPGDAVILTTGFILPGHEPYAETDGPVGAAVLARALALGLRAKVTVVAEEELTPVLSALLRVAELQVITPAAFREESGTHRPAACVRPLSRDEGVAAAQADEYLAQERVRAVVAIEKAGANAKGVYHMVGGSDVSASVAKATALFAAARRLGLLTIGVGDRGNELGFGPLADVVQGLLPLASGASARAGGVADETPADLAVPAVVSNWGAYGIAACLAALLEDPGVLHTPELERELLWTAVRTGAVDGMTGRAIPAVDGIGLDVNAAVVALLGEVYRAQSARNPSPFSTPLIKRS